MLTYLVYTPPLRLIHLFPERPMPSVCRSATTAKPWCKRSFDLFSSGANVDVILSQ